MRIVRDFAWEYGQRNFGLKSSVVDFQHEKKRWLLAVLRKIQVLSAGKMDRIIVPSNYLKKIVSGWGIKKADVYVIKSGYKPPEKISNVKSLGKKGYILLTAGRLVSLKRFDLLIKMLSQLPENYNLAIIGEGPQKEYLQNLITDYGLRERIIFLGSVEENNVFEYMKSSDCFLLNSITEGLSHVLIEAQFAGLPSVATDVGGNREIIENGFNGFLVKADKYEDFKESILKICEDASLKQEMKENCISKSSNFSWDDYLKNLLSLFES